MHCPTPKELPPSPPGKSWPWKESNQCSDKAADVSQWPKISIVTPSFNQGSFIEETIRSVLLQNYPNLEYIVMDGGSTDNSIRIIEKYSPWINYWESKPDRGQSHAINKGWAIATGEILAWLNSDDLLSPGSLTKVALEFKRFNCDWICGGTVVIDNKSNEIRTEMPRFHKNIQNMIATWEPCAYSYPQMSCYIKRELFLESGLLREDLSYVMDHEYWLRLVCNEHNPVLIPEVLSLYRLHHESKTETKKYYFIKEAVSIANEYAIKQELKGETVRKYLTHGQALTFFIGMKYKILDYSKIRIVLYFFLYGIKYPSFFFKKSSLLTFVNKLTNRL